MLPRFVLFGFALLYFALLCSALLSFCFASRCFASLCFASLYCDFALLRLDLFRVALLRFTLLYLQVLARSGERWRVFASAGKCLRVLMSVMRSARFASLTRGARRACEKHPRAYWEEFKRHESVLRAF